MVIRDWLEIGIFLLVVTALVKPVGLYMARVYQGEHVFLSRIFLPVERLFYRLTGTREDQEMDWKGYTLAMLLFNGIGLLFLFLLLLSQNLHPFNPQKLAPFAWDLAVNTAVSFTTNTNWQAYSGESTASYFSQMMGFTVQNFFSTATGMCVLISVIRGFARHQTNMIGNFYVDMTRSVLYILLPLAFVAALLLVSQGIIQNLKPYENAQMIQPVQSANGKMVTHQVIPMGPVASQEAIKELGTNGGGFFGANSSHPFENPTPLSNWLEMLLIGLLTAPLTYTFGKMAGDVRQGWAIYIAMMVLFLIGIGFLYSMQSAGNPIFEQMNIAGNPMEGREVRFGLSNSALFAGLTTATSCGAVNNQHDSLLPLAGMVPLVFILLGEVILGGVGSGLYTMLAFALIAVFVAGLMIGRTPEYLGKKVEVREMWMSVITVLTSGIVVLITTGITFLTPAALESISNPGPHGLSQVMYAFGSMGNNNGSAFGGLNANTPFYTLLGALAMLLGRYLPAVAVLAMAGSLAQKKYIPSGSGTLSTHRTPFIFWLMIIVIIVGALTFFPALALGPFAEHLLMRDGKIF